MKIQIFKNVLWRSFCVSLIIGLSFPFGIVGPAQAAVPRVVNYQSRLRDAALNPITASTNIQYTLYSHASNGSFGDAESSSGPVLWKEVHDGVSCPAITPDADGYFAVQLGACVAFPSYIDFNNPLYLGVRIGTDAEAAPRVLFAAHPYSLNADTVDTLHATSTATANQLLALDNDLNFDISTGTFYGGGLLVNGSSTLQNLNFTVATGTSLELNSFLSIGAIRLDAVGTSNVSSGAYLVGVFDEFANSNATTVQGALRDFDLGLTAVSSSLNGFDLQAVTDKGSTTTNSIEFNGAVSNGDITINRPAAAAMFTVNSGSDDAYLYLIGNGSATEIMLSGNGGGTWAQIETNADGSMQFLANAHQSLFLDGSSGNVGIGNMGADLFRLQVAGNVGPGAHNTYDLGSATSSWRNIYAGLVTTTELYVNGQQVFGGSPTLDAAYDGGGSGAGRFIIADSGPITITGLTYTQGALNITNTTDSQAVYVNNTGVGNAFSARNMDAGSGFYSRNQGTGPGVRIDNNSNSARGLYIENVMNGTGGYVANTGGGDGFTIEHSGNRTGLRINNTGVGRGAYVRNDTGTGFEIDNYSDTYYGLHVHNRSTGYGMYVESAGGSGIYIDDTGSKAGLKVNTIAGTANMLELTNGDDARPIYITHAGTQEGFWMRNTGTGASLWIEDAGSDFSPFVLDADGRMGVSASNTANFMLTVGGSAGPSVHNTFDLGSPTTSWRNIYSQGFVSTTALYVNGQLIPTSTGSLQAAYDAGRTINTVDGSTPVEIINPGTSQWETAFALTNAGNGGGIAMQTMESSGDYGGRIYLTNDTSDPQNGTGAYMYTDNTMEAFEFGYQRAGVRGSSFYIDNNQMALSVPGTPNNGALRVMAGNWNIPVLTLAAAGNNNTVQFSVGTSTPEGKVIADSGSVYQRVDGVGGSQQMYLKLTDGGTTGWAPVLTASSTLNEADTFQTVTNRGNSTTNTIQFAGGTSTGSLNPSATNSLSLGSSSTRWSDVWTANLHIGSSTWDFGQATNGAFTISRDGLETTRIATNGNFGIGTNNPSNALHVVGSARATTGFSANNGTSGSPSFYFTSDADTGMFSPSANILALATGGGERLRIDAAGNLGVGTSTPGYRLDVVGDARIGSQLMLGRYAALPASGFQSGSMIYSTASSTPYFWNGTRWVAFATGTTLLPGSFTLQVAADNSIAKDGYVFYDTGAAKYDDDGGMMNIIAKPEGRMIGLAEDGGSRLYFKSDSGPTDPAKVSFIDARVATDTRGIEYDGDYSAGFSSRSLVDKGFVVNHVASSTGSLNLQQVTNNGNSTTNTIEFAGGTSQGDFTVNGTLKGLGEFQLEQSGNTIFGMVDDGGGGMAVDGFSLYRAGEYGGEAQVNFSSVMASTFLKGLAVGGSPSDPSARLAVYSTTTGFLMPRMTTVQRNAIASPATGLQVYNTTDRAFNYYDGISWIGLATGTGSGVLTLQQVTNNGNSTTNTIQFAGGTSTGQFVVNGNFGINTVNPSYAMDVRSNSDVLARWINNLGEGVAITNDYLGGEIGLLDARTDRIIAAASKSNLDLFHFGGRVLNVNADNFRVGINTTTPSSLLHVQGGIFGDAVLTIDSNDGALDGRDAGIVINSDNGNGSDAAFIKFNNNGTPSGKLYSGLYESGLNIEGDKSFLFRTNNQDRLNIGGDGRIGISTTTPEAIVSIDGSVIGGNRMLEVSNQDDRRGVGFGIDAYGGDLGLYYDRGNHLLATTYMGGGGGYDYVFLGDRHLTVRQASGFVGVGTEEPANRLHVMGGISIASSTPATSSQALYNLGGILYWNGVPLGSASSVNIYNSDGSIAATRNVTIANGRELRFADQENPGNYVFLKTDYNANGNLRIGGMNDNEGGSESYISFMDNMNFYATNGMDFDASSNQIDLRGSNGVLSIGGGNLFTDLGAAGSRYGLRYESDYSADFVARSLVDKGFVVNYVASSTGAMNLQRVTNNGNSTTNTIQFAGGTSTSPFVVYDTNNPTQRPSLDVYTNQSGNIFRAANSDDTAGIGIGVDVYGSDLSLNYDNGQHLMVSTYFGGGGNYDYVFLGDRHLTVRQASGFVGIGTESPSNRLDVMGAISIASSTPATSTYALYNLGGELYWNGIPISSASSLVDNDGDTKIEVEASPDEDFIRLSTSGTQRMYIRNDGRIGIGTDYALVSLLTVGPGTHEASTFSVSGMDGMVNIANFRDKNGENVFRASGSVADGDLIVGFGDIDYGGNGTGIKVDYASNSIKLSNSELRFYENASTGDYVGFIAPASLTTSTIWTLPSGDGANGQVLSTNGLGVLSWINGAVSSTEADTLQTVTNRGNSTTNTIQFAGGTSTGSLNPSITNSLSLGSSSTRWSDVWTANLHIGSSTWDFGQATNGAFTISRDGLETTRIATNGNFGIGTNNPSNALHVVGSARATTGFSANNGTAGSPAFYFTSDADTGMFSPSANILALATGGGERLRIDAAGNLGVGTSTPGYRLDVVGDARIGSQLMLGRYAALPASGFQSGSMIYSTASSTPYFWNGTRWVAFATGTTLLPGSFTLQVAADNSIAKDGYVFYDTGAAKYDDDGGMMNIIAKPEGRMIGLAEDGGSRLYFKSDSGPTDPAKVSFIDARVATDTRGIEYDGDYSAGFSSRSLVDKGFVVNYIASSTGGLNLQQVTNNGKVTTNSIQFAGGTSTGSFVVNGRLGVNTNNPNYALDVHSDSDVLAIWLNSLGEGVAITNDYLGGEIGLLDARTDRIIAAASKSNVDLFHFGGRVLNVNADNFRVGVNTTTPSSLFEIQGGLVGDAILTVDSDDGALDGRDAGIVINSDNGNGSDAAYIKFNNNGTPGGKLYSGLYESGFNVEGDRSFLFRTNNLDRLNIGGDGRIGISTTTPEAIVSIDGSVIGGNRMLEVSNQDDRRGVGFGIDAFGGDLGLYYDRGNHLLATTYMGGGGGYDYVFLGDRHLTVRQASGFVGVGTEEPANRLHVMGGISIASSTPATSSQALYNLGGTLYWNGVPLGSTGAMNLQQVTNIGNSTTNTIQFAGGTSTGSFNPSTTNSLSLGSSSTRWSDVWAANLHLGTSTWDLGQSASGGLVFNTSASEKARLTSAGNLGIGETAPTRRLEIVGSSTAADDLFKLSGGSNNGYLSIFMEPTDDRNTKVEFMRDLAFASNGFGSSMLRLTDDAVGINTDNPTQALSVVGDAVIGQYDSGILPISGTDHSLYVNAVDGQMVGTQGTASLVMTRNTALLGRLNLSTQNNLLLQNYVGGAWNTGLTVSPNGNVGVGALASAPDSKLTVFATGTNAATFRLFNDSIANFKISAADGLTTVNFDEVGDGNELGFSSEGTEIMRINKSRVGIGNTSPSTTFHVVGTSTFTGGNVGIGTASPAAKLQINGNNLSSDVSLLKFQSSADSDIQSEIYLAGGSNATYWDVNSSGAGGALILMNEGTEIGKFVNNGVIINEGSAANVDFRVESDSSTHAFFVDATNGNSGFDQSAPLARLHVGNTTAGESADYGFMRLQATGDVDHGLYLPVGSNLMVWDYNMTGNGGAIEFRNNGSRVGMFTNTGLVVNDGGVTGIGLRVEGDTNANLLYTDAANDRIGVGTSTPAVRLHVTQSGNTVAAFDRSTNDGTVISIRQDSTEEGTISVSGNTVSYNAFTGSHYAWTPSAIEKGMLVSLTGVNRRLHDNPSSEILYGVEKTVLANDDRVMGAYLSLLNSADAPSADNPHLVMAVGNGEVWVVEGASDVKAGDYLVSSDVAGHAVLDSRSADKSYVVARAAEDVKWSEVTETVDGRKHKSVSVFFESFVRDNSTGALLQGQQAGEQLPASSAVVVRDDYEFRGRVVVQGHVAFGGDSVGQAKILSGQKEVRVIFDQEYAVQPIVTVTPLDFIDTMYRVTDVNTKGFIIQLNSQQGNDKLFNWHAFGSADGKVFVSDGTTSTVQVIVTDDFLPLGYAPAASPDAGTAVPDEPATETPGEAASGTPATEPTAETVPQTAETIPQTTEPASSEPVVQADESGTPSGSGSTSAPEQASAPAPAAPEQAEAAPAEVGTVTP